MRGRGRRGTTSSSHGDEIQNSIGMRTRLRTTQPVIALRSPIRCFNIDSSTPNPLPDVQQLSSSMSVSIDEETLNSNAASAAAAENAISTSTGSPSSTAIRNDLAILVSSQYNRPQIDPHPSSNQYHEALHDDEELGNCTANFGSSNSHRFSSVNVTAYAQKLQEENPEEEVESALDPSFVYVNQHKVKAEHALLIRAIFGAHGDITTESELKSPALLSLVLDHVCVVYNKLKDKKFFDITLIELEQMLVEVKDIEHQKLNVGWLREKIENLIKTRIDFGKYLKVKEEERKSETKMVTIERQIALLQAEWDAEKAKNEETRKAALDIRSRVVDHTTSSLVHGLL